MALRLSHLRNWCRLVYRHGDHPRTGSRYVFGNGQRDGDGRHQHSPIYSGELDRFGSDISTYDFNLKYQSEPDQPRVFSHSRRKQPVRTSSCHLQIRNRPLGLECEHRCLMALHLSHFRDSPELLCRHGEYHRPGCRRVFGNDQRDGDGRHQHSPIYSGELDRFGVSTYDHIGLVNLAA
jgi:hypothetical protein